MRCYLARRHALASIAIVLAGCSALATDPDAHLAAFSTQMTGFNQVPAVATSATGRVVAVLNKKTLLLRWKLSLTGLSGPATALQFHGPALIGANASSTLAVKDPIRSPMEGQATLTPAQAADLLAGKWYVTARTAAHAGGEIRGQMILRE